jgi:hypothetical protein
MSKIRDGIFFSTIANFFHFGDENLAREHAPNNIFFNNIAK